MHFLSWKAFIVLHFVVYTKGDRNVCVETKKRVLSHLCSGCKCCIVGILKVQEWSDTAAQFRRRQLTKNILTRLSLTLTSAGASCVFLYLLVMLSIASQFLWPEECVLYVVFLFPWRGVLFEVCCIVPCKVLSSKMKNVKRKVSGWFNCSRKT